MMSTHYTSYASTRSRGGMFVENNVMTVLGQYRLNRMETEFKKKFGNVQKKGSEITFLLFFPGGTLILSNSVQSVSVCVKRAASGGLVAGPGDLESDVLSAA